MNATQISQMELAADMALDTNEDWAVIHEMEIFNLVRGYHVAEYLAMFPEARLVEIFEAKF